MCERVAGKASAKTTPIGRLPRKEDLDLSGLNLPPENIAELLDFDPEPWRAEVQDIKGYFTQFGERRLPAQVKQQLRDLAERLQLS
jgi:phosphoenolpyruvate carboxykinase (GTP)